MARVRNSVLIINSRAGYIQIGTDSGSFILTHYITESTEDGVGLQTFGSTAPCSIVC